MARLDPANHVLFSSATHVYARLGSHVTAELVVNLCRVARELKDALLATRGIRASQRRSALLAIRIETRVPTL